MKNIYLILLILILPINGLLNAQIFYNIEKPPSYQKSGLTAIKDLPAKKYNVDSKGNLIKDKLSENLKDHLGIEKIDGKYIARVKFSVLATSLGEMTLRFNNVLLNNNAHCYVYTSDYEIVAGPIYNKSITDVLNIVRIPANEMIFEIVFKDLNDFELSLNSISFQSIINVTQKSNNSLQNSIPDSNWNCANCEYGQVQSVDNVGMNISRKSWLGADYDGELFAYHKLLSVNDISIDASRAACMIMVSQPDSSYLAYPGTLINFPESNCKGIIITVDHNSDVYWICYYQGELNMDSLDPRYLEDSVAQKYSDYLDNVIIRFNWHHKYGKPLHLIDKCNITDSNIFKLWRKTIDFDEVIDYCGVRGVASSNRENGDYEIIKMVQAPFYKELHLGWTTQRDFDVHGSGSTKYLNDTSNFFILGHHGATPTYVRKTSNIAIEERYQGITRGFYIQTVEHNEPADPYIGWSGSLVAMPAYNSNGTINPDPTKKFGVGLISKYAGEYSQRSYNNNFMFDTNYTSIYDMSLTGLEYIPLGSLYRRYFRHHINADEIRTTGNYYWMPSKENKELCPSPLASQTNPCNYHISSHVTIEKDEHGKMIITLHIPPSFKSEFPNGNLPKGVRIYNSGGDQKTFYFDSFSDDIDIDTAIVFTIDQCDIFYFKNIGCGPLFINFDFYDADGKIINASGCAVFVKIPLDDVSLCDMMSITKNRLTYLPCCSYKIGIQFNGCDDYSNILRLMLEKLSLINTTTNETTALSTQGGLSVDYLNGKISFIINNICDTTSFKFSGLFGGTSNCESFDFTLDCTVPEPLCNCCKVFGGEVGMIWGFEEIDSTEHFVVAPHKFIINFTGMGNTNYQDYRPECQFIFARVYCPSNNPSLPAPIFDRTITPIGDGWSDNREGTLQGLPPGTYCFYYEIHTSTGVCLDTFCVYYNGTFIDHSPTYMINTKNDRTITTIPISTQFAYDKVVVLDLNGKLLIESEPIDKIDVSKLPKGSYNVLYRKKGEIIQTQKLIIK